MAYGGNLRIITFPFQNEKRWKNMKIPLRKLAKEGNTVKEITTGLIQLHNAKEDYSGSRLVPKIEDTHYAGLKTLYEVRSTDAENERFKQTITYISFLALNASDRYTDFIPKGGLPISKQGQPFDLWLDRRFIASIVALQFLCLFPERSRDNTLPNCTFKRLFSLVKDGDPSVIAKLRMIMKYFYLISENDPEGKMRFMRLVLEKDEILTEKMLAEKDEVLIPIFPNDSFFLEAAGSKQLQVDFANKYLGGGVLGRGRVQEEIRFSICPELLSSMLFMECMEENEAVIIQGFEQYAKYKGYNRSLEFDDSILKEDIERDEEGNVLTALVAIDAIPYRFMKEENSILKQYQPEYFMKEINKAYAGFRQEKFADGFADQFKEGEQIKTSFIDQAWVDKVNPKYFRPVATGNWGCGAFGGDPQFKAIIQWIAASSTIIPAVTYYKYGNPMLDKMEEVKDKCITEKWSIKKLFNMMSDYGERVHSAQNPTVPVSLFEVILGEKSLDDICEKDKVKNTKKVEKQPKSSVNNDNDEW